MSKRDKKPGMSNSIRLLIIDDNPDDRALVIRALKKEFEIHVKEIADVEGFVDALEEGNFNVVIMDYQLKWSNGVEVLGKIKAHQPDCPVIMFTGTGNEEIAVEAMKKGLDDYVIKSPKHFRRLPAAMKMAMKKVQQLQEKRAAEQALRESEEKYRSLVESSDDSIYLVDRDCRYQFMNNKHLSRFGLALDKVIGRAYGEFHSKQETKHFTMKANDVFETGKPLTHEYRSQRDNRYFIRTLTPVTSPDGRTKAVTVVSKDITERKRLEERLCLAKKMEALGTLTGGIAHNINNLLMGIMGNVSIMLLDTGPSHPYYKNLQNIEKSVQSGSKLTRQLLGYVREGRYEVKSISLNKLVRETSDTFGVTRKEVKVHQALAENLHTIKAEQGQIEQVLLNLYMNAAEAMPGGGDLFLKTMNVTHESIAAEGYRPKSGKYVLLTVRDTGTGMDKETVEHIFDPFFTTKGLAEGIGLGLASAYGIIKGHGGYINVESEKGHGTTFSIYLPATEEEVGEEKASFGELLKGRGTILLVDDEDRVLDASEQMLKILGFKVLLARGGREALELYKKNQDKIDMVLLDMVMPEMGGGETYDRMKEINPKVKVLLSSGYSINGQASEILQRGCDAFIQKPFDLEQLSRIIRDVLGKK